MEAGANTAPTGVKAIEFRVAEFTVSGAEPLTPPKAALMVTLPALTAVTIPLLPAVLLTFANAVLLEDQVTLLVIVWVLESLNTPVAMKGSVVPGAMERPDGVTEMDCTVASDTVSVIEPLIETETRVAVIVDSPVLTPVAVLF